jgi:DNA-binding LacI/PurR family transcriptional regulator
MARLRFLTTAEQVREHLLKEMRSGRFGGLMPGELQLEEELGVNRRAIQSALQMLESEGLLERRGAGRRRRIVSAPGDGKPGRLPLKVALLNFDHRENFDRVIVATRHSLEKGGFQASLAESSLVQLGTNLGRLAKMVERTMADAWIIFGGSREVLEWFSRQRVPAFAFFGRRRGLPIAGAGPDKVPAMAAATRALIELGHRRVILLARKARRLPKPGASERSFLATLAEADIPASSYHLPDWEETPQGLRERLESLFQVTPPTALIIQEARFFFAALHYLADRGLRVPQDVSIVCTDDDPYFEWCEPGVAHIAWELKPVLRRMQQWLANVSRGNTDLRQTLTPARFVPGGTIGPVE